MTQRSALPAELGRRERGAEQPIYALYDELVRTRDRLAGLAPLTSKDLAPVAQALHEVVWYFLRTPAGKKSDAMPDNLIAEFGRAARDRSSDVYTSTVAALAVKLAEKRIRQTAISLVADIQDDLDSLTFDFRATKSATLDRLTQIKEHLEDRIKHVRGTRRRPYRFAVPPEKYKDRKSKTENPEQFLRRVYGADLRRGLTQADIRDADPAFYNVLHVWCSRHRKRMANLIPSSRARAR